MCYRTGDETGWMDLEEKKETGRSIGILLAFLSEVVFRLAESACCSWSWNKAISGKKDVQVKILWDPQEVLALGNESYSWYSVAVLELKLGD